MNKQLQIEAMAKADGFTSRGEWPNGNPIWNSKDFCVSGNEVVQLPKYYTDNEIDRMVRGLDRGGQWDYVAQLRIITTGDGEGFSHSEFLINAAIATAEQKVEAYLKAKGLWTKEME